MSDVMTRLQSALADRYRIERELGAGGMATVYLAHDLKHARPVALKLLSADIAETIGTDRFEREIRLAARLQHPHICSVYDSGEADGLLWYTMPYVDGESLDARLERESHLSLDDALRIAQEAALALTHAHGQGVIHRDIKPANLLLTRDGSTLVADFGIARAVGAARLGNPTLTGTGAAPGTPAYMSPEQAAGVADVDARSDIYSLALVLFEMLAGERPFPTGSLAAFAQAMTDPVPRIRLRRTEVPASVDDVLRKALALTPDARYATMREFGMELDALRRGLPPTVRGRPGLLGRFVERLSEALTRREPRAPAPMPEPGSPTSLAVLPFRDLSPEQDQTYFSDGLAEELTTALSRIPGLRIAGRSGAFQFRGPAVDVRAAGRTLAVHAVVSGSVRKSGDRLRIGAQVVDVADGFERWAESYDRELADVFQVQEEIARAIAAALSAELMGTVPKVLAPELTPDLEAYDSYLRGRFAWHQRTGETLAEAARCFEAAVARDPSFARAWAGLADACTLLPIYTGASPTTVWPRAKAAAERAIALDDALADAHTSLAYGTMLFEWDWAKAEREFKRAIAADPRYPIAHHWYGDFLAGRGRLEESLASMIRARELDPLSRITAVELGWVYHLNRRPEEADRILSQVLRLDPSYAHAHFVMGLARLAEGRADEAVEAITRSVQLGGFNAHAAGALVAAHAAAGNREKAEMELSALAARAPVEYIPPFALAVGHTGLGDLDAAFACLERGIAERDGLLAENFFDPVFDPLKRDPRYGRILAWLQGAA